ncbi:trem-like transcript 4 protein isoform X2 [Vombatus ursinus]|uniref:trem-like transcript 4 protein isoform X2 n=1 Tax=Vombatus ursinus TaxID=29139 RepID=UPI000FFD656C|nr:trem-like transcript 4 protein isoform X2 [Vombatus ursinus]XP_027732030.1 trem-like transcript 4 protein isoform X2 [Vombatus ursinus]
MAPEILLLLLLSLGNSGKPGRTWAELQYQELRPRSPDYRRPEQAEEEYRRLEGETFSVNCSYESQEHEHRWMSWCKKQENGDECGIPRLETSSNFSVAGNEYLSAYDNNSGIITITITKFSLRVKDSGDYECVMPEEPDKRKEVFRRFHLVVSPVQTQSSTKGIQTTAGVTSNNQAANNSSSEKKFIILGVVLSCLLLLVLLVVGIICTRRIYQKAGKGDDSETQGEKSKGSAMKMESDEDAEDIHYAIVSNRSPRELINTKTHTPIESVEYATITRN